MAHHNHHQVYGYTDFETNHVGGLFELQTGIEMLEMPSRNFFPKTEGGGSSANLMMEHGDISNSWPQPNWQNLDQQINQGLSLSLQQQDFRHDRQKEQMSSMDERFYQTYQLRNSMYLVPAQELLNEFCNLRGEIDSPRQQKSRVDQGESSSSSLVSMDTMELQGRKYKLISMLEEVDRQYRKYCQQMKAVVSSFETVVGVGSANVYMKLASRAMSKHFRCLRDSITSQIQATNKAMGGKDPSVPGATKGETPRLKVLDQCIRQQKSFHQQGGMLESHTWRPQRGLPERSVSILRSWLFEHFLHPYPSDVDKHILARQTGLSRSQVSNWFINARVRLWKPMVEEMYLEETKEQDSPNPNPSNHHDEDQKTIDSDSLTSIVNNRNVHNSDVGPSAENYGVMDLDMISSYNQNFSNGVSLTLGLQQNTQQQQSIYFSREEIEGCSILDGEGQGQLQYRNLMGSQLLHDF